jgi:PTS system mannose-specific IIA component
MVSIVIGTHGRFSEEILKSAEMIFGKQEQVETVTFLPGEGVEDLERKYRDILKKLNSQNEVLFMVDLFGGSPFNTASKIAAGKDNMDVVTGVSLPMLLSVFENRTTKNLEGVVSTIKDDAALGIKSLRESLVRSFKENNNEEEL